jgi:hypothetical protein
MRRRWGVISSPNRARSSRSASGCSASETPSALAAHWRVLSSGVAPIPPKLNTTPAAEAALERRTQARRIVAVVLRPGKSQAALGKRFDGEREMLVLPLADEYLVADD